jgi:hypothetical protein
MYFQLPYDRGHGCPLLQENLNCIAINQNELLQTHKKVNKQTNKQK